METESVLGEIYEKSGMVHFAEINQPLPPLNVEAYWKSSNTEACANNLFQILANNIGNGDWGLISEFMKNK